RRGAEADRAARARARRGARNQVGAAAGRAAARREADARGRARRRARCGARCRTVAGVDRDRPVATPDTDVQEVVGLDDRGRRRRRRRGGRPRPRTWAQRRQHADRKHQLRHSEPVLMRATIINVVLAATLVGGCASQPAQSLVVVSVDADAPLADVATLHVRATVGDQTREFDVHPTAGATLSIPPAQTFGIDLPRSMNGTLGLHVDALDSSAATVASGDGSGAIRVGARADITLRLAETGGSADMGDDGGATTAADMALPAGDMVVIPPAMLTIDK